jgi:predicted RNA-binding Zn-ribbon protein involved in translation (DUF1610 family)
VEVAAVTGSPCEFRHELYEGPDEDGIFYNSKVRSWGGWPEDVVERLRAWNRNGHLSFVYLSRIFTCPGCGDFIDSRGSTAARFFEGLLCDDCLVFEARA